MMYHHVSHVPVQTRTLGGQVPQVAYLLLPKPYATAPSRPSSLGLWGDAQFERVPRMTAWSGLKRGAHSGLVALRLRHRHAVMHLSVWSEEIFPGDANDPM